VAAARALEVSQANGVVSQFGKNQDAAMGALGLEEVQLAMRQDLLQRVRELAVQAGSTSLTPTARKGIATNCVAPTTNCSASPTPRMRQATICSAAS
jgi:flagellin-like hook-associated protein FlgL